uniref:Uncharacterized protein n=1 Tax=Micromonas pusilla TaxID=38833 RepID=A0A7S0D4R1_MICPS
MSASARVPHVDEAVNFRDLALGINDWYNVTPSVRVAIEGLALVVQDQAARLERFEQHFGVPGIPGVAPARPGTAHSQDHQDDVAMLSERVERLSQELAATKAKLRAVESSRGGADDAMASAAERACDLATQRAETAAREACAAARECRAFEQTVARAESAASEATRARDAFSASLAVKTESSESRVRAAAAKAEVRCREAADDVRRVEALVRDIDIATLERDAASIAQFTQSLGTITELKRAVFGEGAGGVAGTPGGAGARAFSTPGTVASHLATPASSAPKTRGGDVGVPVPVGSLSIGARLAEVEATALSAAAAIEAVRAGEGTPATEALGAGLQQLHAAVGASLKDRPTTAEVLSMVEETLKTTRDETSETFAVLAKRTAAAEEAAATNTRRVGVVEDVARGMERRQKRTERLVEDVRRAWSAAAADRDTAMIRAMAAGGGAFEKRSEFESEDTSAPSPRRDDRDFSDDDSADGE